MLFDQNTDSPDLGPPPVVNFDLDDPGKFDAESEQHTVAPYNEDFVVTNISENLETRKRRRDGGRLEVHRTSDSEKPLENSIVTNSDEAKQAELFTKNGAKRKHNERDNQVTESFAKVNEDGFCFSRKAERLLENSYGQQEKPIKEPDQLNNINRLTTSARRVLGESKIHHIPGLGHVHTDRITESVNTDPVTSPKKDKSKKPPSIQDKQKLKGLPRNRLNARKSQIHKETDIPLQPQSPVKESSSNDMRTVELKPKTPDPPPLTSPPISTSSAFRQKSRDTPPPTDLHPGADHGPDSSIEQARPSRRARTAVNYAEPNLNRKMRRPTGAMVDAIGREERRQSSAEAVVPIKVERTDEDVNNMDAIPPAIGTVIDSNKDHEDKKVPEVKKRTVFIKTEGNPRFDWKNLPIAPSAQHSPGSRTSLEREPADTRSSKDNFESLENRSQPAASSVISTLVANGRQPSRKRSSLMSKSTESITVAEQKEQHGRFSRRSSSSSNASDISNRSIYDMRSSPSAETVDGEESVSNDANEHGSTGNSAGSLRAKRLSTIKTRRVSVGPGNMTTANSVRRERGRVMSAASASTKGLESCRYGGDDNAEDDNGCLKEDRTRDTDNVSVVNSKSRTAPRRRSMLL